MDKQVYRLGCPLGAALMAFTLTWAEECRGEDLVVTRESPVTYEMNAGSQTDVKTFGTIVVHASLSLNRLGSGTGVLGISATDSLSLGPSAGDVGSIVLYNETYFNKRNTLETPLAKVGENGGWGTVNIEGGHAQMTHIEICEAAAVPENSVFLTLSKKNVEGSFLFNTIDNLNSSPATILFNGGRFTPAGGASTVAIRPHDGDIIFLAAEGKDIIVENGNLYASLNLFNTTDAFSGSLKTAGSGNFVIQLPQSSAAEADTKFLIMDAKFNETMLWGHTGDVVFNRHSARCSATQVAPCGENVGVIRLSSANSEHPSIFAMGGYSQSVNGIVVNSGEYGKVTATAGTTLNLGAYKDGELTNVEIGEELSIVQVGHTIALGCDNVPSYEVQAGVLDVKRTSRVGKLTLANGSTVTVAAGAELRVGTLVDNGATFTGTGRVVIEMTEGGGCLESTPSVTTIKTGDGTYVCNEKAPLGDVDVRGGVLKLAGAGSTNEYWQVTINESGWRLNIAAIGLFAGDSMDSVLDGYTYRQVAYGSVLGYGEIQFDTSNYQCYDIGSRSWTVENPSVTFSDDSSVLLSSRADTGMSVGTIAGANPNGLTYTFRRAEGESTPVTAFSLRYPINAANSAHTYAVRSASKFVIRTSTDGVNWVDVGNVDDRGEGTWGSWTNNRSHQLMIPAGVPVPGGKGLKDGANVKVATGATLDLSDSTSGVQLSKLTIDAEGSNGTIVGASLAQDGVIVVQNFTSRESLKTVGLLSFPGVTANLSAWIVMDASGRELNLTFVVKDGVMMVQDKGLIVTVR